MKTIQVTNAYKAISPAKLTKMDDADKFKVIKAIRVMKPIATSFEDFVKDAHESLKDEDYPKMDERGKKWNEKYGDGKKERSDIPAEDLKELDVVNAYFADYRKKVDNCLKEEADKEHELSFDKLTEEAFGKFISSNDFDVNTIVELQEALM